MDTHRLAQLLEAWLLRARVAAEDGPQLDALTEAQAAIQALDTLHGSAPRLVDEE